MKNMKNIAIATVIIAAGAVAYFVMHHRSESQNVKIQATCTPSGQKALNATSCCSGAYKAGTEVCS